MMKLKMEKQNDAQARNVYFRFSHFGISILHTNHADAHSTYYADTKMNEETNSEVVTLELIYKELKRLRKKVKKLKHAVRGLKK